MNQRELLKHMYSAYEIFYMNIFSGGHHISFLEVWRHNR
ncbi:hypothetical protein CHCC20335_0822 [Bacillus paralicheniformis]|nr:hypothetical protein CHCC20335_0822 [Bacillus paralicheniformis]